MQVEKLGRGVIQKHYCWLKTNINHIVVVVGKAIPVLTYSTGIVSGKSIQCICFTEEE